MLHDVDVLRCTINIDLFTTPTAKIHEKTYLVYKYQYEATRVGLSMGENTLGQNCRSARCRITRVRCATCMRVCSVLHTPHACIAIAVRLCSPRSVQHAYQQIPNTLVRLVYMYMDTMERVVAIVAFQGVACTTRMSVLWYALYNNVPGVIQQVRRVLLSCGSKPLLVARCSMYVPDTLVYAYHTCTLICTPQRDRDRSL